jgi:pimeloyl-ACP methyl ester carboxylesterase
MRARYPDVEGFVDRDGVKIAYEVFGDGDVAIVFVPIDSIIHSRAWKAQVPYLARHFKVVTIDPRGNGRSDRPTTPDAYADTAFVADTIEVMDAAGIERAVLVGICASAWRALLTAATHPGRVQGVVAIAPWLPHLVPPHPDRVVYDFDAVLDTDEGWAKCNRHYWARDWPGFAEWFFDTLLVEPHSTKQHEDVVGWAMETSTEIMLLDHQGSVAAPDEAAAAAMLDSIACPVLAIHGTQDRCQPLARGEVVAERTGGQLLTLEGAGHLPQAREPVLVNTAIRQFAERFRPPPPVRRWTRPLRRERKVLFLSSPIGLGHSRRDLAIADALRAQRPDVKVDWLAQHPLTELLGRRGERIHPASAFLAGESAHMESESAEHDLHAFQAIRRMDEILVNNFMVFDDLVADEPYDAWVGDEAWELDYFLHENPERKRAPFAWLTDFVGWLPMPDGGEREAALAADYNAEMVEQVARFPSLRDRALFVGEPGDVVPGDLGPGLPGIGEWTGAHFDFVGYVTGFDPATVADRAALRAALGYRPDELVCVATVGGSGVGTHLLARIVAAYPEAKRLVPALRLVVVTGPRIDPAAIAAPAGVEVHAYVHDLYRHLAACDLAVVQGGLTTAMELTANRRPFLYVPLRHHFEQNFHVRHRLERHRAGRRLDYDQLDPDTLAAAIAAEIGRDVDYLPVAPGGAARAAASIAELL